MHPCHVWRLEHAQERWEAFQAPGVEQNCFIKEICNIFRWIAGEILNTLVMSTYASLWVYIYFSLSVGYMSLCVPFTCGFQFTISIHCHLLLVCWLGTGQVQAIIFDLDGTLIDFEGGPNQLILNRQLVSCREGWLGRGLVSSFLEVEPLWNCSKSIS